MNIIHKLSLDVTKRETQRTVVVSSGDSNVHELAITLSNNGIPVELPNVREVTGDTIVVLGDDKGAYIKIRKPNGSVETSYCTIEGNIIHYTLKSSDLVTPSVECQLCIYSSSVLGSSADDVLYSPIFEVAVSDSIPAPSDIGNKYDALTQALAQAKAYYQQLDKISVDSDGIVYVEKANGTNYCFSAIKSATDKLAEMSTALKTMEDAIDAMADLTDSVLEAVQSGGVVTFNSRSGVVTPQNGDYTASMVGAIAKPTSSNTGFLHSNAGTVTYKAPDEADVSTDTSDYSYVDGDTLEECLASIDTAIATLNDNVGDRLLHDDIVFVSEANNTYSEGSTLQSGKIVFVYEV